jgi:hypothetical protein
LLGRLHALDRLIDIVCDAAGHTLGSDGLDAVALKKLGFARILESEEPHLILSRELIAALRRSIGVVAAEVGAPIASSAAGQRAN